MPTAKISKRIVDAALPGPVDAYVWDEKMKGFGLKVTPAGKKVYLVQYRRGGRKGRTRRVTIGEHGRVFKDVRFPLKSRRPKSQSARRVFECQVRGI